MGLIRREASWSAPALWRFRFKEEIIQIMREIPAGVPAYPARRLERMCRNDLKGEPPRLGFRAAPQ